MTVKTMLSNKNYAEMECRIIDAKGKVLDETKVVEVEGEESKREIFTIGDAVKKYGKKQMMKSSKDGKTLVVKIGK